MLKISSSSILAVAITFFISGCTQSSQIIKVEKDNVEQYKIFHPSLLDDASKVRKDALDRANKFCNKSGANMVVISERTNKPPYIIDNFPGIEIVFACEGGSTITTDKPTPKKEIIYVKSSNTEKTDKYGKLAIIKKFLDDGTLTQQEFDEEKRKILADD